MADVCFSKTVSNINMNSLHICIAETKGQWKPPYHHVLTHCSKAYSPSSRPMPDCLKPPNGTLNSVEL